MRSDGSTLAIPANRRHSRRDWRHVLLLGLFLGFVLVVALGILFRSAPGTVRQAAAITDDDLTTGSIVFVPLLGNRCRNRLIDNSTWHIRDNGEVDCRAALSQHRTAPLLQWSSPRIDVIRHGFTRR